MEDTIKLYDRVRVKGQAIFGQYLGCDDNNMAYFQDEETHKIDKYEKSKIEKAYEKY